MTKPVSFRLDDNVIQTLDAKAKAAGVSKTDFLTSLIVNGSSSDQSDPDESESRNSFSPQEKAKRDAKKQATKDRKTARAQAVAAALPSPPTQPDTLSTVNEEVISSPEESAKPAAILREGFEFGEVGLVESC